MEKTQRFTTSQPKPAPQRSLLDMMRDEHLTMDSDFRILTVNRAAQNSLGRSEEELAGLTHWEAFPASVGTEAERTYRRVMATREEAHFTHHYVGEGYDRFLEIDAYPTDDGGMALFWRDVSVLVRSVEALRESEEKYRTLFEVIDEGYCILQMIFDETGKASDYRFLEGNRAFEEQTGLFGAVGRTAREMVPDLEDYWYEIYGRVAKTGESIRFQNGSKPMQRWFDVFAFRVGQPEEHKVALLFKDVTAQNLAERERVRLLEAAESARLEAEAANRSKSEFLTRMSHELRTPLNAIGGYTDLIEMGVHGPVTPQQQADLSRIRTSQHHLLGLINEVLNYAKLEMGVVQYEMGDVRLSDGLAEAHALIAPQAQLKGIALNVVECPPTVIARTDPEKLRQILLNLLSNAVKFTPAGGRIDMWCEPGEGEAAINVRDTGIGIPADKMEMIFDPFVQVRGDLARPHEGTGLGLAISRDLARGIGGGLTASSEMGVGSTFTLLLPLA